MNTHIHRNVLLALACTGAVSACHRQADQENAAEQRTSVDETPGGQTAVEDETTALKAKGSSGAGVNGDVSVAGSVAATPATSSPADTSAQGSGMAPEAAAARTAGMLSAEQVKSLQTALNAKGAKLAVNGQLDADTHAAIKAFQRQNGLAETGDPTAEVLTKLGLAH
jgi:hypothetical protein